MAELVDKVFGTGRVVLVAAGKPPLPLGILALGVRDPGWALAAPVEQLVCERADLWRRRTDVGRFLTFQQQPAVYLL